jgi:hypothetical protein
VWRGRDRKEDTNELADAIAAAVELFNRDGALVRLNGDGELINVNLAGLRELIDESICGVRAVNRGTRWQREYFSYRFDPLQHPGPRCAEDGLQASENRSTGPDSKVLEQIYRVELLWPIPKEGA